MYKGGRKLLLFVPENVKIIAYLYFQRGKKLILFGRSFQPLPFRLLTLIWFFAGFFGFFIFFVTIIFTEREGKRKKEIGRRRGKIPQKIGAIARIAQIVFYKKMGRQKTPIPYDEILSI